MIKPGDLVLGHDAEILGRGRFAVVKRGRLRASGLEVDVAVKDLNVEFSSMGEKDRESVEREIGIMRQMSAFRVVDPAAFRVVAMLGFLESPVQLVVEFMANGTLLQLLRSHSSISSQQQFWMTKDVVEGMMFIHSQQILHRDLKSTNILMDDTYRCTICDFNLSTPSFSALSSAMKSSVQADVGTLAYRAPETFGFKPKYSKASDIFSFAIVLWEILTREVPYCDIANEDIRSGVKDGDRLDLPKEASPDCVEERFLLELVPRCWDQKPEQRPSFALIYEELSSCWDQKQEYCPSFALIDEEL